MRFYNSVNLKIPKIIILIKYFLKKRCGLMCSRRCNARFALREALRKFNEKQNEFPSPDQYNNCIILRYNTKT